MPYKAIGRGVYQLKGGRWRLKQTSSSPAKARATVRLLYGLEGGWKPTMGLARASRATRYRVAQKGGRASRRR